MSPQPPTPAISDVTLERYRLGELPPAEHERLATAIAADPALAARLAALDQSARNIVATYPADAMAAAVRRKARAASAPAESPSRAPRVWLRPALVAVASVCLMAVAATLFFRQPVGDDTTIKGGPALVLHRKTATGSAALTPGAAAREGDQIRVGYRAAGQRYGAILSIDGRGNITAHLPRTGDRAATLQPAGTVFLDFAYELDDAPRWERFYFVTSETEFDLGPIRQALRDANGRRDGTAGPLSLPSTFAQFVFPLTKEQP
jgi:hypothetical protein